MVAEYSEGCIGLLFLRGDGAHASLLQFLEVAMNHTAAVDDNQDDSLGGHDYTTTLLLLLYTALHLLYYMPTVHYASRDHQYSPETKQGDRVTSSMYWRLLRLLR